MQAIKFIVAYDGTHYHGFAKQKEIVTVQSKLEEAISYILRHEVEVIGAGRTDAGVHAKGQCCMFESDTTIPMDKLRRAINSKLPPDIIIKEMSLAEEDFHPRFSAKRKTYRYQIRYKGDRDPFNYRYEYFYPRTLNIEAMKDAASYIVGTHDFKAFCAAGSSVVSTVRTVYRLDLVEKDNLIQIDVCGDGFLYNMVRIIVGTLLKVGLGQTMPHEVKNIIKSKDRTLAGSTVPPHGLMMLDIEYE